MKLASGQIAERELLKLLAIPLEGTSHLFYTARWRSSDFTSGTSTDDLNEIEDIDGLLWLDVEYYYPNGDALHFDLICGQAGIRWIGAGAADKARRLKYEWDRLPARAKVSYSIARFVVNSMSLLSIALASYWFFRGSLNGWQWGLLLLAIAFSWPPIFFKVSLFTSHRAFWKPFIVKRSEHWWRDYKWLISTIITLIAAGAAVASTLLSIL